ncbi:MAG TPA: DUF6655 family protein [Gemmataceae bacterium]|nr:DUF6655 family protein [Gemmataceae bacterium]
MRKSHRRGDAGGSGTWTILLLVVLSVGCGTMRTSDTTRTATEQLLISHSIDDSVSRLDFRMLAGKRVYFDAQYLDGITDKGYLISSLRQQLLAGGCLLQEDRKKATYVVEARAGSVGTDSNGMLIGVPQMSIPAVMPGVPGMMIPEIALAKKSNRRAVAKVAVFAYNRVSGDPIWQSGAVQAISRQRNSWLCGAGPFQRGSIHRGTEFDDQRIVLPGLDRPGREPNYAVVGVTDPAIWKSGPLPDGDETDAKTKAAKEPDDPPAKAKIVQTSNQSHPDAAEKSE